jgi:hypothetical protein
MRAAWTGPLLLLIGGLMLAWQACLWISSGVASSRLLGGGVGLVLLGAATSYYYWEDRRAPRLPNPEEEDIPTAEEYEQSFHVIDEPPENP